MTESYDEYAARSKGKRGAPVTTGRFDTREELEERVLRLYDNGGMNHHQIAVSTGVSDPVVTTIIIARQHPHKLNTNGSKP